MEREGKGNIAIPHTLLYPKEHGVWASLQFRMEREGKGSIAVRHTLLYPKEVRCGRACSFKWKGKARVVKEMDS
eukprot:scaffold210441_cov19-Tisochrysis_lutea.AAC.1